MDNFDVNNMEAASTHLSKLWSSTLLVLLISLVSVTKCSIEDDFRAFCKANISGADGAEIPWQNIEPKGYVWVGTIVEVVLLLYCFVGLAVICDDYLAIGLETLCRRWEVKEDVAGATFMAVGSAAPEIVINIIAAISASAGGNPEAINLGVSAIIGSGMVAFLLAPGLCAVFSKKPLILKKGPVTRDIVAYLVAVVALVICISNDGAVTLPEAIILFAVYFIYLIVTIYGPKLKKRIRSCVKGSDSNRAPARLSFDENTNNNNLATMAFRPNDNDSDYEMTRMDAMLMEEPEDMMMPGVIKSRIVGENDDNKNGDGDEDDDEAPFWLIVVSYPLSILFMLTTPNSEEGARFEKLYVVTIVMSFLWVAVFSFVIMTLITNWDQGLPVLLLGASVVALGGEIPDTIQSISVAKRGNGQMAVANCVGSKIVNVGVGLGLTWIISILSSGQPVYVCDNKAIEHMAMFHTAAIVMFSAITVGIAVVRGKKNPTIDKPKGYFLIVAYFGMMGGYVAFYFLYHGDR